MLTGTDFLLSYRDPSKYVTIPSPLAENPRGPTINGTIEDMKKDISPEQLEGMQRLLYNDVKKCSCGKPCAFTLLACNACGNSLADVPITQTENVFVAFLLGVERSTVGFPLAVMMRHASEDLMIIDDLLAMSAIHLNAIPANYYIPDWRFLCNDPEKGLDLLRNIQTNLMNVTRNMIRQEGWMKCYLKDGITEDMVLESIVAGFNFPPSQFQLHVQWIVCPWLPFHIHQLQMGNHMHKDRFFPLEFVMNALSEGPFPKEVDRNTPIEEIVKYYDSKLPEDQQYNKVWQREKDKATRANMEYNNWQVGDFTYIAHEKKAYTTKIEDGKVLPADPVPDVDVMQEAKVDSQKLQGYGRPYKDGKPSGGYFPNPRQPVINKDQDGPGFTLWLGA